MIPDERVAPTGMHTVRLDAHDADCTDRLVYLDAGASPRHEEARLMAVLTTRTHDVIARARADGAGRRVS
jgi:hypothetical protein